MKGQLVALGQGVRFVRWGAVFVHVHVQEWSARFLGMVLENVDERVELGRRVSLVFFRRPWEGGLGVWSPELVVHADLACGEEKVL